MTFTTEELHDLKAQLHAHAYKGKDGWLVPHYEAFAQLLHFYEERARIDTSMDPTDQPQPESAQ